VIYFWLWKNSSYAVVFEFDDDNNTHVHCDVFNYHVNLWSGIGYNGFPRGCSDDKLPWAKVGI
jgi:dCMP deaminase